MPIRVDVSRALVPVPPRTPSASRGHLLRLRLLSVYIYINIMRGYESLFHLKQQIFKDVREIITKWAKDVGGTSV